MDALQYLKEEVERLDRELQAPCNWHLKFKRDHLKAAAEACIYLAAGMDVENVDPETREEWFTIDMD